ncbi:MAG TPA: esterase-like activity of phytase family protein [Gaiellaceae bacterium]|nr:esterase-like activity of phytase family protein [Gaiellaceae bacterium]
MFVSGRSRSIWALLALAALLATAALAPAATAKKGPKRLPALEFRGQAIIPTGTMFQSTNVGGLSSIAHAGHQKFYVISDDQANARFYKLRAEIADGQLDNDDITFKAVTILKQPDGTPYPAGSLDPEGFALTKHNRRAIVTSEGFANSLVPPWIRLYKLDGTYVRDLPVPDDFIPATSPPRGVRQNLGFESAGTRGKHLFTGTEAALVQDGPAATLTNGSPARLMRYDVKKNVLQKQWTYMVDPIAEPPVPTGAFGVSGLVEVLPIGKKRLLTMERSFSVGAPDTGNTIKLYVTELREDGSTSKTLLLNLDALGIPLDNVEGMAFGPRLRGGKRTLLLVSDNNFAPAQFTQFLLFAYGEKQHGDHDDD